MSEILTTQEQKACPPIKITVRQKEGAFFVNGPLSDLKNSPLQPSSFINTITQIVYSQDGKYAAMSDEKQVFVYNTADDSIAITIDHAGVQALCFSPQGNFLVTWEKPIKTSDTSNSNANGNLIVWHLQSNTEKTRFFQKEFFPERWPTLKWSDDDRLCARLVSNEVHLFDFLTPSSTATSNSPTGKIRVPGMTSFEIAPQARPYTVATFVPEKDVPAVVKIIKFPLPSSTTNNNNNEHKTITIQDTESKVQKSFYKAQNAILKWNSRGDMLLIQSSTDVDKTGKTYYGETGLHMLHADGSFSCTLSFSQNPGPVQDAQWGPSGKEFIVIQGTQPAQATLFLGAKCEPLLDFGSSSVNTIRWSPHGRFVCLGGFGNLAGDMDFWDVFKKKKIGSCQDRDGAKSFEWTPDGRSFITCALFPWRRVDNGFKIWSYAAELIYHYKTNVLHQVAIRPALPDVYPNLPQSPRLTDKRSVKEQQLQQQQQEAAAPKAYVPPALRRRLADGGSGSGSMGNSASATRGAASTSTTTTKSTVAKKLTLKERVQMLDNVVTESENNGEDNEEDEENATGANKKKKKTTAERRKQQQAKQRAEEEKKKQEEEAAKEVARLQKEKEKQEREENMDDEEKMNKKWKNLTKKLRQIELLREKEEAGESLDQDAIEKLKTETSLKAELKQLQKRMK